MELFQTLPHFREKIYKIQANEVGFSRLSLDNRKRIEYNKYENNKFAAAPRWWNTEVVRIGRVSTIRKSFPPAA